VSRDGTNVCVICHQALKSRLSLCSLVRHSLPVSQAPTLVCAIANRDHSAAFEESGNTLEQPFVLVGR
jgi:hypothetical protein